MTTNLLLSINLCLTKALLAYKKTYINLIIVVVLKLYKITNFSFKYI